MKSLPRNILWLGFMAGLIIGALTCHGHNDKLEGLLLCTMLLACLGMVYKSTFTH
jgi:hypothetical protein